MQEYFFFKKGQQIVALESADREKNALLVADGWEKLFEEIQAPNAESAILRLADIRKEEIDTEHAFTASAILSGLLRTILK